LKTRWITRSLVGLGCASLFSDFSHEMITAGLPAYLASIGGGALALGFIEGVADALSSFVKPYGGWLGDRPGREIGWIALGYGITGIVLPVVAFTRRVWQVLAARVILLAVVPCVLWPIALVFVRQRPLQKPRRSFADSLSSIPKHYGNFLAPVGVFGTGNFSHTLLILVATAGLAPLYGARAAVIAVAVLCCVIAIWSHAVLALLVLRSTASAILSPARVSDCCGPATAPQLPLGPQRC